MYHNSNPHPEIAHKPHQDPRSSKEAKFSASLPRPPSALGIFPCLLCLLNTLQFPTVPPEREDTPDRADHRAEHALPPLRLRGRLCRAASAALFGLSFRALRIVLFVVFDGRDHDAVVPDPLGLDVAAGVQDDGGALEAAVAESPHESMELSGIQNHIIAIYR